MMMMMTTIIMKDVVFQCHYGSYRYNIVIYNNINPGIIVSFNKNMIILKVYCMILPLYIS